MSKHGAGNLLHRLAAKGQGQASIIRPRLMPLFSLSSEPGDSLRTGPGDASGQEPLSSFLSPLKQSNSSITDVVAPENIDPAVQGGRELSGHSPNIWSETETSDCLETAALSHQNDTPLKSSLPLSDGRTGPDQQEIEPDAKPKKSAAEKATSPVPPPEVEIGNQPGKSVSPNWPRADESSFANENIASSKSQPEISTRDIDTSSTDAAVPHLQPVLQPVHPPEQPNRGLGEAGGTGSVDENVEVHISIGRIEVRPPPRPQTVKQKPRRNISGPMTLQNYLMQRDGLKQGGGNSG